jgi:hypothetical protein
MADDFSNITQPYNDQPWTVDHPNTDFNVPDDNAALSTGDMRRKYNFGNSYTTLAAKRDPFLHLLNRIKGGKVATDDPKFKFTTRRACGPQHRYGYVVAAEESGNTEFADQAAATAAYAAFSDDLTSGAFSAASAIAVGDQLVLKVVGDYLYGGNKRNAYANANQFAGTPIAAGANDTAPRAFLKDQLIKVPMKGAAGDAGTNDWMVCKLNFTPEIDSTNQAFVYLSACVVKTVSTATNLTCASFIPAAISSVHDKTPTFLEACRTYPIGSAYHELSGYGESWKDQPWSTDYGFCQIFKTTMMMSNRAQSTVLKYEPSEWKRVWGGKLQEHAWDVAQAGYFGVQSEDGNGVTYTQGAVDYIINNGNQFAWNTTYTVDDFMDDMSVYKDPRTDLGGQIAYFCNSEVWNWMQKQGGYLKNNSEISTNFEFQLAGRGIAKGVPFSKISTVYGDLNLIRDVHLDGTNIKMLGVNLNGCRLRPLIGNGKNRDTTVYVGVKTIENSGEDYRVDLIQTDIGYEFSQPETHAIWL